ncbi:MAG: exosortase family protein XrtG [Lachnospiraceae bacterium]|nr:exosortase family protein XrtG [Lachnospiraceae bacterium]
MFNWIIALIIILWVYLLTVLKRAKLDFWFFVLGSAGLFTLAIVIFQPLLLVPMQNSIAAVSGLFGELTNTYTAYFEKGLLFVTHKTESLSLYVDFECSGIIETFAFIALLWFFPAYRYYEKIMLTPLGIICVFASNVLRIFVICIMLHWFGNDIYFFAHAFVGRMVFYACTVSLYFYVFTKSHVTRQKVGAFSYDDTE